MKRPLLLIGLIAILAGGMMVESGVSDIELRSENRSLRFQHARDSLIIDSLRNPVDTTEFIVEHSELK